MPKPLELRKVVGVLKKYGIVYVTGKGRHPKFYDPETHKSYPIKSHGKMKWYNYSGHSEKRVIRTSFKEVPHGPETKELYETIQA